ncbi:DNA repair protein RecO|uniref:DNA repair protein RecO n=1 Tax=Dendrosporobacter quercicolus TaxID=146817 RepID=A0A1G9MRP9_9FIRM|nr:DNA repair protein RecO [Dendrosporobacter quercicolus]NSL47105.1 DNA repair protein RecO [Dendrosporobacter quercicolus DSM 1736]SDL76325.1 DNA replication and repair protein RecO [Dendrosporobacter quercicolus]
MSQYLTEAILLSVRNWGEADKMVTVFSRNYGKITAIAYGCRRPQNRLAGVMQVFSQAELSIMPGKGLDTIKQGELKQSFRKIKENLDCMAYAAFINELVVEFCPDRQPEPLIYDLLIHTFSTITNRNPRLVALASAWQLLALAGYRPQVDCCVHCGQTIGPDEAYFSAEKGGSVCLHCEHQGLLAFSPHSQAFTANLLGLDWENLQGFSVNGATLRQTEQILTSYVVYLLGKPLKSLNFIQQVAGAPGE